MKTLIYSVCKFCFIMSTCNFTVSRTPSCSSDFQGKPLTGTEDTLELPPSLPLCWEREKGHELTDYK